MPIIGNIIIVLTVVFENTSLRSELLRSESCLNRSGGPCHQGTESEQTRQTRVEENCFCLHFSDKGKAAQDGKSLTSINQYSLMDFAIFEVTVFLYVLSIVKVIKSLGLGSPAQENDIHVLTNLFALLTNFK